MSNFAQPQRAADLARVERLARRFGFDADADRVGGDDEDQDDAGDEAAEEQPLGGDAGDGAVEDHRQRRRKEQAERSRRGHEAEREALGVLVLDERGEHEAAERQDGDARAAGEGREERHHADGHEREAARHPAEERLVRAHQALRGAARGHDVAGEREQRDRRQRRVLHQLQRRLRHRRDRRRIVGGEEEQHGQAAHGDEHRRAERERGDDAHDAGPEERVRMVCAELEQRARRRCTPPSETPRSCQLAPTPWVNQMKRAQMSAKATGTMTPPHHSGMPPGRSSVDTTLSLSAM